MVSQEERTVNTLGPRRWSPRRRRFASIPDGLPAMPHEVKRVDTGTLARSHSRNAHRVDLRRGTTFSPQPMTALHFHRQLSSPAGPNPARIPPAAPEPHQTTPRLWLACPPRKTRWESRPVGISATWAGRATGRVFAAATTAPAAL